MMSNNGVLSAEDVKELAPYYEKVVLALKQVYDPEIPVNVYDLGLIYELHIDRERQVEVTMTLTAPNCPLADQIVEGVRAAVEDVPGIQGCELRVVFDPPWDRSMLSEEALVELGLDY